MPIKILEKPLQTRKQVVNGTGISAVVAATVFLTNKIEKQQPHQKAWRVLLDSGSDGDLIFITKKNLKNIPHKKRYSPEKWETSNGTFKTTKVGSLELIFPDFSRSKIFSLSPNVVELQTYDKEPMFDLIIGVETLAKFGVVLDFASKVITIDKMQSPMRPINALKRLNFDTRFFKEELEPISTREETKRTIEILDANYKKADLPAILKENCSHLNKSQKHKFLRLLLDYEELFDGTLGDFQTDPVKFNLQLGAKAYHGRPYPIPHSQLRQFRTEVDRLEKIGVIKK